MHLSGHLSGPQVRAGKAAPFGEIVSLVRCPEVRNRRDLTAWEHVHSIGVPGRSHQRQVWAPCSRTPMPGSCPEQPFAGRPKRRRRVDVALRIKARPSRLLALRSRGLGVGLAGNPLRHLNRGPKGVLRFPTLCAMAQRPASSEVLSCCHRLAPSGWPCHRRATRSAR